MAGAHAPLPCCGLLKTFERLLRGVDVPDEFPVHQVVGVENGQAGRAFETGSHHVEVFAHADDVGVGVVGVQDGILVGAIAVVGYPDLGDVSGGTQKCAGQKKEDGSREGGYGFHRRAKNSILPEWTGKVKEQSQFSTRRRGDAEKNSTRRRIWRNRERAEIEAVHCWWGFRERKVSGDTICC